MQNQLCLERNCTTKYNRRIEKKHFVKEHAFYNLYNVIDSISNDHDLQSQQLLRSEIDQTDRKLAAFSIKPRHVSENIRLFFNFHSTL